jgi:phosphoribosylformylglycinamidine synthase
MLAGGLGHIQAQHIKKGNIPVGSKIIVLGGPAMLIGLGGGAASSNFKVRNTKPAQTHFWL